MDLVSAIRVGDTGLAYVVNAEGRLIAHPDNSLVLRNTNLLDLTAGASGDDWGTDRRSCSTQQRR